MVDEFFHVVSEATRPIALMNATFTVVATRSNWYLTSILPEFIDARQKGFIRRRLGLDHVIDIEVAAFALAAQGAIAPALLLINMDAASRACPTGSSSSASGGWAAMAR